MKGKGDSVATLNEAKRGNALPVFRVMMADSLRDLIAKVNENNRTAVSNSDDADLITKDSVVQLTRVNERYILLYVVESNN